MTHCIDLGVEKDLSYCLKAAFGGLQYVGETTVLMISVCVNIVAYPGILFVGGRGSFNKFS